MSATAELPSYRDPKRHWWLIGGLYVWLFPPLVAAVYFASGGAAWTVLLLPANIFLIVPLLDALVGEDPTNPPEAAVPDLTADRYYMGIIRIFVVIGYLDIVGVIWFLTTQDLPLWAALPALVGAGVGSGALITMAHELGHKTSKADRLFAKIALGAVGYGHFTAEHNLGHHKNVSTPEDCASARMGESVYAFATRELPGAFKGGWAIEAARLRKRGQKVWSRQNEILQVYAITLGVAVLLVAWLGLAALPWLILHHALAWFALTMVNYIEHYGLLRQRRENGRYEPCAPHHSWNTNHVVSNVMQIHLQRHSDHHTHPMRPYQALRNYDDLPRLPSGYPGCLGLAAIPPLWFRVMDPRVMAWADGDLSRVNMHEPARARLTARWGNA
jgi:alkane 1-monooxygenase